MTNIKNIVSNEYKPETVSGADTYTYVPDSTMPLGGFSYNLDTGQSLNMFTGKRIKEIITVDGFGYKDRSKASQGNKIDTFDVITASHNSKTLSLELWLAAIFFDFDASGIMNWVGFTAEDAFFSYTADHPSGGTKKYIFRNKNVN